LKQAEGVFKDGLLLLLLLVVIDEIGLEIVLDEISGAFVFRVEHTK
jgi:hypothetical protein